MYNCYLSISNSWQQPVYWQKNKSPEIHSFADNSQRSSDITTTWLNFRKYKILIQKYNQTCWMRFFSCDLRFFLFFTNWMKVRKRFPPHPVSFDTTLGCFSKYKYKDVLEFLSRLTKVSKRDKKVRFCWEETWIYD